MTVELKTLTVKLSDAEIDRNAKKVHVRDLRDARHPALHFRYTQSRARGSWYLVVRGKWKRIAGYPDLNTQALLATLPAIRARFSVNPDASASVSQWATVGELMDWFADRQSRDRNLSDKRRKTSKSAIACHIKPRIGELPLTEVNHANLDRLLMWPMQETLSLDFVRLVYQLLPLAFRQAHKLDLIQANPMTGIKFSDFSKTKIRPKASRLRGVQLEGLLDALKGAFDAAPSDAMLALMMLCHGTRVGETRMTRWDHISLAEKVWFIPTENTKTRCEHHLPLTDQVCALLMRYRDFQTAAGYDGHYLFPNRRGKCLSETQGCAVFTRLGKGEWTSHDLRKVARTGWADLGVDFLIGELLVNHAMGHNVKVYIHSAVETGKREALAKWHAWLDGKGFAVIHGWTEPRFENTENSVQANNGEAFSQSMNQP